MKFIDDLFDRVLDRLLPVIKEESAALREDANKQMNTMRKEALAMIAAELPKMAASVSEAAVKTIFEHTTIDEAASDVSNTIDGILRRLPFGLGPQ